MKILCNTLTFYQISYCIYILKASEWKIAQNKLLWHKTMRIKELDDISSMTFPSRGWSAFSTYTYIQTKCVITVCSLSRKEIFNKWRCQTSSRKIFFNEPQASFEKIFRGRVWHHHELEISFGRQEHTVISLLFKLFANLTRKIVKLMGEIIIALYNNDHYCTVQ